MSDLPPRDWLPPASASDNGRWPLTWMGDEGMEEVRFVDYPLLQEGTFHLVAGPQHVGKGALCAYWVARCTNGDLYGEPRPAIWIANEETPRKDLNPRIKVAGGDMMKVASVPKGFRIPRDIDALGDYATSVVQNVGLIVIDPLSSHTGTTDTNAEEEVRAALEPLAALAETLGILIIGVRHLSSKETRTGVLARILGSTAWVAVPRAILAVVKDEDGGVHVRTVKGSRVPEAAAGRKFRLEGMPIEGFERTVVAAVPDGESNVDLDALLEKRRDSSSEKARRAIVRLVREAGGQIESDLLDAQVAAETGVAARTARNMRTELRDRGWIRMFPEREGETISHWMVALTNAAPYTSVLADDDPPRARARGESQVSGSSFLLPEPTEDLSLFDSTVPVPDPPQESREDPPSVPTTPTAPSSPTCPVCGSANVGALSGRCRDCGSKVTDGTDWSTVHVPGLEEAE